MKYSRFSPSRRDFLRSLAQTGVAVSLPWQSWGQDASHNFPEQVISFPRQWSFMLPKGAIILVSDQQLDDLCSPDKEVDLSLSATPELKTLRKICEDLHSAGGETLIVAFDEFWNQYRPGQGGKIREYTPDTPAYIDRIRQISAFAAQYGIGLELSLLSPLELGRVYRERTGESGRWIQYKEGWRDPVSGEYLVEFWEQAKWTNNKGTITLEREGVRVFAFREQRVAGTDYYAVNPKSMVELKQAPTLSLGEAAQGSTQARRLLVQGAGGENEAPGLDRVLVVAAYRTPELDYFHPNALPYLKELVDEYHQAGVKLHGLYSDEIHIQGDWNYFGHQDDGEFCLRYLTRSFAEKFAALYGEEFADFEKYFLYFCRGQHGFLPTLDADAPAQHVLGEAPEDVQRTWLLRRRYYDLLEKTVAELFVDAKRYAESLYARTLEARAHATWAQSPTIDLWRTGGAPRAPRQYEYTPDFVWSNTVQQAACACSDYFRWNEFLTGGGNDHAEGGWSDRNYYGLALACSTGILNEYPNAYAAAWGMPYPALARHHALEDAYGAWGRPQFMAVTEGVHRDIEVLILYPISLVAADEHFGSWMVQFGYANYITPEKLLQYGQVQDDGIIALAGRKFGTLVSLFEPLPPQGLLEFLELFAAKGGKIVCSGPLPYYDLSGAEVRDRWRAFCGVAQSHQAHQGLQAAGSMIKFTGPLGAAQPQYVPTAYIVDWLYPVEALPGVEIVAQGFGRNLGLHRRTEAGGSITYLGFRPRDDQCASLGYEVRTLFDILAAIGAYPAGAAAAAANDNPSWVSRSTPWLATSFPNGATVICAHYKDHVESWPGGFHRDEKVDAEIIAANPLPPESLEFRELAVNGHRVSYTGRLIVAFRMDATQRLAAFSGYDCAAIEVNGREHRFADQNFAVIAWAPVPEYRRIAGGAVLEIWVHGEGDVRLPLDGSVETPKLYFAAGRAGAIGGEVPCNVSEQTLHFAAKAEWGMRKLYLLSVS